MVATHQAFEGAVAGRRANPTESYAVLVGRRFGVDPNVGNCMIQSGPERNQTTNNGARGLSQVPSVILDAPRIDHRLPAGLPRLDYLEFLVLPKQTLKTAAPT